MNQTVRDTKKFEVRGILIKASQKDTGKNKKNPHTEITIGIPKMDNRKFEEMCFNDGYKICFKIEYIPNKDWEVVDS